jgi:hypothetical protein
LRQVHDHGDERTLTYCTFCGGETGTRDHCPSRVFLDKPYPEHPPAVPACAACNASFSLHEQYLACLLSCAIAGSTDPDAMPRTKIGRTLAERPLLRRRLEEARTTSGGQTQFRPEHERVSLVLAKLARGHALYELHESCVHDPSEIGFAPLSVLTSTERGAFEVLDAPCVWPEVGSRMLQRLVTGTDLRADGWIDVQPGRYRYHASVGDGVDVRIVIQEYLACRVLWRD